jgi:CubicO group peptidase (beta-lactamase class C family)
LNLQLREAILMASLKGNDLMNILKATFSAPVSYAPAFAKVRELLAQGVEQGVFPGAVLLVGKKGEVVFQEAVGVLSNEDPDSVMPTRLETVFDIASLTQPVVTASLMMMLIDSGKLKLSDKVTRYVPGFGVFGKSEITIRDLLDHSSGLIHWHPFYEDIVALSASSRMGILASSTAKDYVYQQISRMGLRNKPGSKQIFSDIGFILLGQIVERLVGAPLNKVAHKLLFHPLGMTSSSFIDLPLLKRGALEAVPDMIAPTENCSWRKRILTAEVHDDNAWAMGGISGHAGCFSTAQDLHLFASSLLAAYVGQESLVSQRTVRDFFYPWINSSFEQSQFEDSVRQQSTKEGHHWRLGWEGPNTDNGMSGAGLSPFAVGHSGFTGCSLWLEPEAGIDIVLMTNRVHPSRNNKKILEYRPALYAAVSEALR